MLLGRPIPSGSGRFLPLPALLWADAPRSCRGAAAGPRSLLTRVPTPVLRAARGMRGLPPASS